MIRRLHIDDLGRARPAKRPCPPNDKDALFIDPEGRVVDAFVIVLRTVKDERRALEDALIAWLLQVPLAKLIGNNTHLHDGKVEQVALQHQEASTVLQRLIVRSDHLPVARLATSKILCHGLAGNRATGTIKVAGFKQLPHDSRRSPSPVEALTQILAGRLNIRQKRNIKTMDLPILREQLHPGMLGHGRKMWLRIGRSAIAEFVLIAFKNA